jgi:hypothetical protein
VGKDLQVLHIVDLDGRVLVGKFGDRRILAGVLTQWMVIHWVSVFGYSPVFHLLSCGWICFVLKEKEDLLRIISVGWFWDCQVLCAKFGHPLFDANIEGFKSVPAWIKKSNLSLDYWSDEGLQAIGNVLGNFIVEDISFKSSSSHAMAQILVELDPSNGLYESIKLVAGKCSYV